MVYLLTYFAMYKQIRGKLNGMHGVNERDLSHAFTAHRK